MSNENSKTDDKGLSGILKERMKRVNNNLLNHPHKIQEWDVKVDEYSASVEKIRSLVKSRDFARYQNSKLVERLDLFLDECANIEFEIAFVGTIKTGKSTLINAILGGDYASMSVTPETAALSKFRQSDRDYVNVTFFSQSEWNKLWKSISSNADTFREEYKRLGAEKVKEKWIGHSPIRRYLRNDEIKDELKKWSSSQSPEHYFVKEIEVGISTLPENFPKRVVFVDTPGLSDPVQYRSDITKNYIQEANAVIVCVNAQALDKEAISIISSSFSIASRNKENVYIIATHWDKINSPIDRNWVKLYDNLQTQLVGPHLFPNKELAKTNIMYSSAYIYSLFRDYDELGDAGKNEALSFFMRYYCTGSNEEEFFNNIHKIKDIKIRKQIMQSTNIDAIRDTINSRIVNKHSMILRNRIKIKYDELIKAVDRYSKDMYRSLNDAVNNADMPLRDLKEKKEKIERQKKDLAKYNSQLKSVLKRVEDFSDQRLKHILKGFDK